MYTRVPKHKYVGGKFESAPCGGQQNKAKAGARITLRPRSFVRFTSTEFHTYCLAAEREKHTGRGEADTAHNAWLASHRGGIHQYRESPIQICTACKVRQKQVQIFVEGDMGCSKLLECSAAKASLAAGLAHRPSCPHENRRENE